MSTETIELLVHDNEALCENRSGLTAESYADDIDTLAFLDDESLLKRRYQLSQELGEVSIRLFEASQLHANLLQQILNPEIEISVIGFETVQAELTTANQTYISVLNEIIRANYFLRTRKIDTRGLEWVLGKDIPAHSVMAQSD